MTVPESQVVTRRAQIPIFAGGRMTPRFHTLHMPTRVRLVLFFFLLVVTAMAATATTTPVATLSDTSSSFANVTGGSTSAGDARAAQNTTFRATTGSAAKTFETVTLAANFNNSGLPRGFYAVATNPIIPYIQVNGAAWLQTASATVSTGAVVNLGPQPLTGTWSWTGPKGYTSTARQINSIPLSAGSNVYVATYTAGGIASTETFTITVLPAAATPTFSPLPGTYSTAPSVTLSDTTPGAAIYYTTNGTTPSAASTLYSKPIAVSASTTIEAIAVATNYSNSIVASGVYALPTPITPYIQVNNAAWLQAASTTVGAGALVNLGPQPLTGTWSWTGPNGYTSTARQINSIPLSVGTNTYVATYINSSAVASTQTFTITVLPTAATPTFSPLPGNYSTAPSVTLSDTTPGAAIYYTTNGTTPSAASTLYSKPIAVSASTTIEAIAVATNYSNSIVASGVYALPTPITPYIQVNNAAWLQAASTTVVAGAVVNLGPQPLTGTWSWTGPNGYTSTARQINSIPLSVGTNTYVATYINSSAVASTQTFTITVLPTAATPTFSPLPGNYSTAPSVTLSDTTPGAAIYYTTNGTTPSAASTLYSKPIAVSASTTIEAIAVATNYSNSIVASGVYALPTPITPYI